MGGREVVMVRVVGSALGALVVAVIAIGVIFIVGMRTKYPPVTTAVRRMNRRVMNPRAMKTAGTPGAYAGVIRHVGRTSGTEYETPIGPYRTNDGFVVALPYGTSPDWLKNLMAAGSAVIIHEGESYAVDRPEIVDAAGALDAVPPSEQTSLRVFNVDEFLRVRVADDVETK
jgi:deazaflavin-dependent oxidoreductase (nitroreductase family)